MNGMFWNSIECAFSFLAADLAKLWYVANKQALRARNVLQRTVQKSMKEAGVDAFIGNASDWEKVCVGNLVGMPVMIVPTGLKNISDPPIGGTNRRTTITTGIYAAPYHDGEVNRHFLMLA